MRITSIIARYLLGALFLIFGLNGFLSFLPMPQIPGLAGQFMGAFVGSHYMMGVCLFEVAGAILLLAGRFVPLGLTFLGPVIVNILFFHVFLQPAGLPPGIIAALLWCLAFYGVRRAFAGIFLARVPAEA